MYQFEAAGRRIPPTPGILHVNLPGGLAVPGLLVEDGEIGKHTGSSSATALPFLRIIISSFSRRASHLPKAFCRSVELTRNTYLLPSIKEISYWLRN